MKTATGITLIMRTTLAIQMVLIQSLMVMTLDGTTLMEMELSRRICGLSGIMAHGAGLEMMERE